MADLEDLIDTLVATVEQALSDTGDGSPPLSAPFLVYGGWPVQALLEADLAALAAGAGGRVHVTVFPEGEDEPARSYLDDRTSVFAPQPTLTLSLASGLLSVGGTAGPPQLVSYRADGALISHATQSGEGPVTAAQALLALSPGASLSNTVLTLRQGSLADLPRVAALAQAVSEIRRQIRTLAVHVFADSPARRLEFGARIEAFLADLRFLALPDRSFARLTPTGCALSDATASAGVWRRDILYQLDYATTLSLALSPVLEATLSAAPAQDGAGTPLFTSTAFTPG